MAHLLAVSPYHGSDALMRRRSRKRQGATIHQALEFGIFAAAFSSMTVTLGSVAATQVSGSEATREVLKETACARDSRTVSAPGQGCGKVGGGGFGGLGGAFSSVSNIANGFSDITSGVSAGFNSAKDLADKARDLGNLENARQIMALIEKIVNGNPFLHIMEPGASFDIAAQAGSMAPKCSTQTSRRCVESPFGGAACFTISGESCGGDANTNTDGNPSGSSRQGDYSDLMDESGTKKAALSIGLPVVL